MLVHNHTKNLSSNGRLMISSGMFHLWWVMFLGILSLPPLSPLHAQSTSNDSKVIRPNSDLNAHHILKHYTAEFTIYRNVNDSLMALGNMKEELKPSTDGETFLRVQKLQFKGQSPHVDSVMAESRSLAPVWHRSTNTFRTIYLMFEGNSVTGKVTVTGPKPIAIEDSYEAPLFDSNWVDVVQRVLPLEVGYRATIKTHEVSAAGKTAEVDYRIEVTGKSEPLSYENQSIRALVVQQTKNGNNTEFYLHPETHEVLQIRSYGGSQLQMVIKREA